MDGRNGPDTAAPKETNRGMANQTPPSSTAHGEADALSTDVRIGGEFGSVMESIDDRRQTIALQRTYSWKPAKLASLGAGFGVSRERARQLEVRLRHTVDDRLGDDIERAAAWLRRATGPAASPQRFRETLDRVIGDAPTDWKGAAEVAVMREAGYQHLDGVVGNEVFRNQIDDARRRAPTFANVAGVVYEDHLRKEIGADDTPEWDSLLRCAGLARVGDSVVLRDTRRVRVYLALDELDEPQRRQAIAGAAGLQDTSSLSSLLSSDPLFVRFTKDKWGLADWTEEPYEGVVEALVKRIRVAGGVAKVEDLVREIPERFDVLPATVRNYLSTRKFEVDGDDVRIVEAPEAPAQSLRAARDVVWTADGAPVLHFVVGDHHLRGNSQKISFAVAQHLGVGLDDSAKVPFCAPQGGGRGVGDLAVVRPQRPRDGASARGADRDRPPAGGHDVRPAECGRPAGDRGRLGADGGEAGLTPRPRRELKPRAGWDAMIR